jgi:hypothetical protein
VNLSDSLFSMQKVPIGAEHSLSTGPKPCGLWVDAERPRFVRRPVVEILNSAGEWEPKPKAGNVSLGQLFVRENDAWVRALAVPRMLDGRGFGNLCKLRDQGIYGREIPLAMVAGEDAIAPVKWLRKKLEQKSLAKALFDEIVPPFCPRLPADRFRDRYPQQRVSMNRYGDVESRRSSVRRRRLARSTGREAIRSSANRRAPAFCGCHHQFARLCVAPARPGFGGRHADAPWHSLLVLSRG